MKTEDDESGEADYDPEEDLAAYEHYRVYGDKPRLMPDLSHLCPLAQKWAKPDRIKE
jgi:hypothetical protein